MRDVKEILRENGNMLITVGNSLELDRTTADVKVEVSSTFERAEKIYENSDIIIFLDGGTGTLSEFCSFLNNKIETDDKIIDDLRRRYKEGLASKGEYYFKEVKSPLELKEHLEKVENKLNNVEERSRVR